MNLRSNFMAMSDNHNSPPVTTDDTGSDWYNHPPCPNCEEELSDPAVGTDDSGSYTVLCRCGCWVELLRRTEVVFLVHRHANTIPPWVFGTED